MLSYVTDGISTVIGWIGEVIDALFSTGGALATLAPLFAIGVAISAIMLGVKLIKGMIWGS